MRLSCLRRQSHKVVAATALAMWSFWPGASRADNMTCGQAPFAAPSEVSALFLSMGPVFAAFPDFEKLLTGTGLELCLAPNMIEVQGYYEPDSARIVINASAPLPLQQAVLVHELRHVQQRRAEVCPRPDLSMREHARAIFAMEADASAISHLVAWALREKGQAAMWNALSAWPLQDDISNAFAAEMHAGNDIAIATQAAFSQWYDSQQRVDAYYHASCANYLDVEDSEHRLRSYETLEPLFFENLCILPNGAAYACHDPR